MKLLVFHLLNDYSGSPKVLSQNITSLISNGCHITLVTSKGGILDRLRNDNLTIHYLNYKFSNNRIITLLWFLLAQITMFFYAFKYGRKNTFYINTILPFGASIAAKILKRPIIYHYHENAEAKGIAYKILSSIMLRTADKIICVSKIQASTLPKSDKIVIIPNAIPEPFESIKNYRFEEAFTAKRVLMLCSLKKYKGINEFWKLAELMPKYNFELVINDNEYNIKRYIRDNNLKILPNLIWHPRQSDVIPYYLNSSIILNLSNKNEIIETFGLTAIEGIACGRPIIGPTVGGISEIIQDDFNGYKIDVQNLNKIKGAIEYILSTKERYVSFCKNSLSLKSNYSEKNVVKEINNLIKSI